MDTKIFKLESNGDDYLDFGISGINSYKVSGENKIIVSFHSSETRTSRHLGLIQSLVLYAKNFNGNNEVILFTCHASKANLGNWIPKVCTIISANGIVWYRLEKSTKTLYVSEERKSIGLAAELAAI